MVVARRFLIGSRVPPSRLPLLYFRPARTTHLLGGVSLTLPGSRLFPVATSPLLSLSRRCCTSFYYDIKGCVEHTLLVKQYLFDFIFPLSMGVHIFLRNATIFCLVMHSISCLLADSSFLAYCFAPTPHAYVMLLPISYSSMRCAWRSASPRFLGSSLLILAPSPACRSTPL